VKADRDRKPTATVRNRLRDNEYVIIRWSITAEKFQIQSFRIGRNGEMA
jgi:hypothetical protein